MSFSWLPWTRPDRHGHANRNEQGVGQGRGNLASRTATIARRRRTPEVLDPEALGEEELTGSHSGRSPRKALCLFSEVAVVTAATAASEAEDFEKLAPGARGSFLAALGSREERLQALSALQYASRPTRRTLAALQTLPEWAEGRAPASLRQIDMERLPLSSGVRQAADRALAPKSSNTGPGFGTWAPPAMVFELDETG